MVIDFFKKIIDNKIFHLTLIFILIYPFQIYSQKVRIMPIGDSITRDSFGANPRPDSLLTGYRQPLWLLLQNDGYPVDFTGSDSSGYGVVPRFDPNNAGFGGYTTKQLLNLIKTGNDIYGNQITPGPYFNYYPADILLLHIGTNGLDTSTTDLEDFINYVDDFEDTTNTIIWIILSKIINRVPYNLTTAIYNNNIEKMAEARIKKGDHIKIVDMEKDAGLVYQIDSVAPYNDGDIYDGIHPNNRGYAKMASLFYDTLKVLLSKIIPVELTSFYYIADEDSVILHWQTALELNNYGFAIERSTENDIWENIGFVEGANNSYYIQKYHYIDVPSQSTPYIYKYRLKQIENNGRTTYLAQLNVNQQVTTSTQSLTSNIPLSFELNQNYPNPFNPITRISYSISKESKVRIKIYNALGEEVATLVDELENPGIYEKTWNAGKFSSGIYIYVLDALQINGQNPIHFSKKMVLLK